MIMKKILNIFYWLILVIVFIIAGIVASSSLNIPGGIKFFSVQSGSMEPAIHTGSIVIVKAFSQYHPGDIITFKSEADALNLSPKVTTTHRIFEIQNAKNQELYKTKGDANNAPDQILTNKDLVIGKTIFSIPLLGFPVSFAKTKEGLIILVVIPATIIIYSELLNIKDEALRLIKVRQSRKLTKIENVEEKVGEEINEIEKDLKKVIKKPKKVNIKKK
jgi:signal peptidase